MQLSKHRNTVELPLLGVQGAKPPARKSDVILRVCPQAYTPEGSRAAPFTRAARCLYEEV
jgi:hypothetical protein